jgi:transglutaminase-like putative cysteine protease
MRAFLESERRGHCEYFASATVLLLRAAGIPARYHTGFALVELDPRTRQWKVRGTHGHAWATAWLDGQWQVIDTTPPDWLAQDSEGIDFWQKARDWWEEKRLTFQEWRTSRLARAHPRRLGGVLHVCPVPAPAKEKTGGARGAGR